MMALWHSTNTMDSDDSSSAVSTVSEYWLTTVIEDRAESAPPPATDGEADK
jgi:hypothetical protein